MNATVKVFPGNYTKIRQGMYIVELLPASPSSYMVSVDMYHGSSWYDMRCGENIVAHGEAGGLSTEGGKISFEMEVPEPPETNAKEYSTSPLERSQLVNVHPSYPKKLDIPHSVTASIELVDWEGKPCKEICPATLKECGHVPMHEVCLFTISIE